MPELQFHFLRTEDGSPTLEWRQGELCESMHHPGGAYAETQYIYGWAVRSAFAHKLSRFVSVGLGLGYNEFLIAAEAVKHTQSPSQVVLRSFELVPELSQNFLAALGGDYKNQPDIYTQVFAPFEAHYGSLTSIKQWLLEAHAKGNWTLEPALSIETCWKKKTEVFLYDAFSGRSSPELWQEEFLDDFLKQASDEKSIFCTYACKSSLKRSLLRHHFQVQQPSGFHRKRQCTRAWKNIGPLAFG